MFLHHVYFWLKNPNSASDKADLMAGLSELRVIPTIRLVHLGQPAGTNRGVIDATYSVSWLLIFDDAAGEAIYQDHPLHHAFVAKCGHLWEKVVVYDSVNG
jgi:Stress responsive A/B Barrel Domain